MSAEREAGRREGVAIAFLMASGQFTVMHDYARGAGIPEEELERLLTSATARMLTAVSKVPSTEEAMNEMLGNLP